MAKPGSGLGRGKGREPVFDRELILDYHKQGYTVGEISLKMSCSTNTVRQALKSSGVYKPRNSGRPRQAVCQKGHDQSVWRREDRNGRGFCGKCKSIRDKGYTK